MKNDRMHDWLTGFPAQVREALSLPVPLPRRRTIGSVVFCGMGGSGISGDILKVLADRSGALPFQVHKDYGLPGFAGRNTLVVTVSYSGNTEETLSAYTAAGKRGCIRWALAGGGALAAQSARDRVPLATIPGGLPPRCAFGYLFFPCLRLAVDAGIIARSEFPASVQRHIATAVRECGCAGSANQARRIARRIHGRVAALYSGASLLPVLTRWKGQLAENSKTFSSVNVLPEMNHNEIMAWRFPEWFVRRTLAVFAESGLDGDRVARRLKITREIVAGRQGNVLELKPRGTTLLEKMMSLLVLGDWVSYHLARLNRVDPVAIPEITLLKERMTKHK